MTWLFVTMFPSVSIIAPEPFATPPETSAEMETTDFATFWLTEVQSTASPDSAFAVPEPLDEEFSDDSDDDCGSAIMPFAIPA